MLTKHISSCNKLRFLDMNEEQGAYLSQEAVHEHLFQLTEAVHPVYALYVIWGIPRGIKDDDPVSSNQINAKWTGSRRDEKQSATKNKDQ